VFGGYNYPARSTLFEQQGASRWKPSAEVIGLLAAVGAVAAEFSATAKEQRLVLQRELGRALNTLPRQHRR